MFIRVTCMQKTVKLATPRRFRRMIRIS